MVEDLVGDSSKWYPDKVAVYYAIARALVRVRPALDQISSPLADRIVSLRDESGDYHNVLQASQAVSALQKIGHLGRLDLGAEIERFLNTQRDDGSWPELLAFGDQSLKFGAVGQIGHGSESVTSAFCIEALECLSANLRV